MNAYLAVFGKGGENGIFHVNRGGYLTLSRVNSTDAMSVSAEDGFAIYQEDGAFFSYAERNISGETRYDADISGKMRYPILPVVLPFVDGMASVNYLVTTLPLEGEIDTAAFPQTIPSYICKNGESNRNSDDLPVSWNFEEFAEELGARERFVITGEYTDDVMAVAQPACLVTFLRKNASVFLQCSAYKKVSMVVVEEEDEELGTEEVKEERVSLVIDLSVKLDDPSMEHRLEWSMDGESWQWAKPEDICDPEADGDGYLFWRNEYKDGTVQYEGDFSGAELPRYFSIATTDANGRTTYSDTIYLDGSDKIAGWDNGGGRGGETNPGDPEDDKLPPITTHPPSNNGGGGGDDEVVADREEQETDKPKDEPEKTESMPVVRLSAEPLPTAETDTPPSVSGESLPFEQPQPDSEADTVPTEPPSADAVDAKPASEEPL